jgi:hypothetical protein
MNRPRQWSIVFLATLSQAVGLAQYPARGGSNYYFYEAVPYGHGNGYNVITEYYLPGVASKVSSQIADMAGEGQRIVSLPLFFKDGQDTVNGNCPTSGTAGKGGVMDSSTGEIQPACLSALISIIRTCYTYGLAVRLRFFPAGDNNPTSWELYDPVHAAQNWSFIQSVHNAMTAHGLSLDKYDLGNEEIGGGNKSALAYAAFLWREYTALYGSSDTVGFSVVCDANCTANLAQLPNVYGPLSNFPPVFDLHIYGQCGNSTLPTAQSEYVSAVSYTQPRGWTQGWIVGETCYDDGETAEALVEAHNQTPQQVLFYIQQWPYYFKRAIGIPYDYRAYSSRGF